MRENTTVSIIIPCRNEEAFIGGCLDSILANAYPKHLLEVLIVDGMSSDQTRAIVQDYGRRWPFVRLIDNLKRIAAAAFNIGIRHASGDLIMIAGAHSIYSSDYILNCVRASNESGADNVGAVMKVIPRDRGFVARALVSTLGHRFGVGNAHFRCENSQRRWVDTVFGGCYRKEVFQKIGLFNEGLVCNQDLEFNLRLRRSGGRILLIPEVGSFYYARSEAVSFCRHNFRNGYWVAASFLYTDGIPVSWRHLVPACSVGALAGCAILGLASRPFAWVALAALASYMALGLWASTAIARRDRDFRYVLALPIAFCLLHSSYGTGSLTGLIRIACARAFWRKSYRWFRECTRSLAQSVMVAWSR